MLNQVVGIKNGTGWNLAINHRNLKNIIELAEEVFELKVKKGIPDSINGIIDIINNPRYATVIGIAKYVSSKNNTIDTTFNDYEENNILEVIKNKLNKLKDFIKVLKSPPETETLLRTIDLCEKWNNAILNLAFTKDVKVLTENIDTLVEYPVTSVPARKKVVKQYNLVDLKEESESSFLSFQTTLKQMLITEVEDFIGKGGGVNSTRTYGLNFEELVKYIDNDIINKPETIDRKYNTRKLDVLVVDKTQVGNVLEESFVEPLIIFPSNVNKPEAPSFWTTKISDLSLAPKPKFPLSLL